MGQCIAIKENPLVGEKGEIEKTAETLPRVLTSAGGDKKRTRQCLAVMAQPALNKDPYSRY